MTFFFYLPFKGERSGRDHMYCTKSNMCHFLWACYMIKGNNNKEKSFCRGKLPFCWHKLPFCQWKLNLFWVGIFFAGANYNFADAHWEKPILSQHFFADAKNLNCKGCFYLSVPLWWILICIPNSCSSLNIDHFNINLNFINFMLLFNRERYIACSYNWCLENGK